MVAEMEPQSEWTVQGPRMWAELHHWALGLRVASDADRAQARQWLNHFARRIPCGDCRRQWTRMVYDNPPPLDNPENAFAWTVRCHNAVNERLGKATLPLDDAFTKWTSPDEVDSTPTPALPPVDVLGTGDVECEHARPTDRLTHVSCALGLFGGKPHKAICADCMQRRVRIGGIEQKDAPAQAPAVCKSAPPSNVVSARVRERVVLRCFLSPGDVVTMTTAVRELHRAHPGRFVTAVESSVPELWEHNPHVAPHDRADGPWRAIDMHYPLINQSNQRPVHFLQGYVDYLAAQLRVQIPLTEFRADVHLSEQEKNWMNQVEEQFRHKGPFWILMAGGKYDFTTKWWPPAFYQQVVDHFLGRVQFVQCGSKTHWHPPLRGVLNLIGQTSIRQFVRLMYHAQGVVCPVTFAMHLAAAVPTKDRRLRPCVVIAGGREPSHWEAYPGHQFLHTIGCLPCCADGGCWKSRCQPVGDGDRKNDTNICDRPVQIADDLRVPQCMTMIQPLDVIRAIERALAYSYA